MGWPQVRRWLGLRNGALADAMRRIGAKPKHEPALIRYRDQGNPRRAASRVLVSALGEAMPNRDLQLQTAAGAVLAAGQQPILVGTHLSTALRFSRKAATPSRKSSDT